ncbi:hypothetical protein SLEP1_g31441 [Rubroshorea leprosula]|uniref:Uncharacterized protein n=1 Tax=Rubroshorea leprosula TaxID=152421 RepID=A0AAV5K830_9ROSI|nr:hypothetical protein SLEP1_g31441 [Rubroshorea leprosula]
MNLELWAKLVHLWTEDEGHLRRSSSAKANRAKGLRVTHTSTNPEGRLPTYPEVYTNRRQHKGKGKDQLFVYCNDEAQEIGEKLTAEYATRQEEEGFDPTIPHGEILLRATGGVKKGWLKAWISLQKAPKSLIWFSYAFLFHLHPFLPLFSNQG